MTKVGAERLAERIHASGDNGLDWSLAVLLLTGLLKDWVCGEPG